MIKAILRILSILNFTTAQPWLGWLRYDSLLRCRGLVNKPYVLTSIF